MIQLHSDCLVFEDGGTGQPAHVETLAAEVLGDICGPGSRELVRQAAAAVLHYFKHELGRDTITLGEFIQSLEHALKAFGLSFQPHQQLKLRMAETDLHRLATEFCGGCELVFFPALQAELHRRLQETPQFLRFYGLHDCVKHLRGTRRWTPDCQELSDQIVDFLRQRLEREWHTKLCALVVC